MTEVTYRALAEAAFEEISRLSALGVRSEDIVMVVTQDVFWAASVYESRWCLNHNVQELTVAAKFYGHDVGAINEEAGTIFRAAIKGCMVPRTWNLEHSWSLMMTIRPGFTLWSALMDAQLNSVIWGLPCLSDMAVRWRRRQRPLMLQRGR